MKNFTLNRNHTDYRKLICSLAFMLLSAGFAFAQNATNGGTIGNDQSVCPGETPSPFVSITPASGGDASAAIEYLWMYGTNANFPGAGWQIAPGMNNQDTYNPPAVGTTTYFIRCARRNGFTAFQAESNVVTVTALPSPFANINGADNANVYTGFTYNLMASYSASSNYSWDFNGDGFPDCFGQNCSFTYNIPGTYNLTLTVTNSYGCSSSSVVAVTISAPTNFNITDPCNCGNPNNQFTPTAYYNNDHIMINSNPGENWFYTNTGATVYNMSLNPIPNGTPIPEVQPGVYFLNLWFVGDTGTGWSGVASNGQSSAATGPGAIANCGCVNPLPVDLTSFDGYAQDGAVILKWATSSETDNAYFEVEASTDGARFDVIAQIEGAGTTSSAQNYTYTDNNPADGINYYRLRQVDTDGDMEEFKIISVNVERGAKVFQISPNPVKNVASIQLTDNLSAEAHLELVSPTGQTIKVINITANNGVQEVMMNDVASGVYFIRLVDRLSNEVMNQKIIKQ